MSIVEADIGEVRLRKTGRNLLYSEKAAENAAFDVAE
jgi:hypothetical protein